MAESRMIWSVREVRGAAYFSRVTPRDQSRKEIGRLRMSENTRVLVGTAHSTFFPEWPLERCRRRWVVPSAAQPVTP